jgi:hypothetical protein
MNALHRNLIAGIAAAGWFAGAGSAQTIVNGTGNPDIDIAAVQAAVDKGGRVMLRGSFSFNSPPAMRGALPGLMATILVSKGVTISGTWDEHGQMTTIDGGDIPFAVEAGGAAVKIERLHFNRPQLFAIFVDEVNGLTIESCLIEGVEPLMLPDNSSGLSSGIGIYVSTVLGLPTPAMPGIAGNIAGKLSIHDNEISVSAAADHGIGIMVVNAGIAERPVDVDISGNTVRNTTLKGINLTQITGRARIERNTITTSATNPGRAGGFSAGIHCGGLGTYLVTHNVITVADPGSAGIRLRGYPALGAAIEHATITDNDVTMSAAEGAELGVGSAGIEIMGLAKGSLVQRNRIRGRARVGLSVVPDKAGSPSGNTLDQNDHQQLSTQR